MIQRVLICGRDCHPGGPNCNNYCGHDPSKPLADLPMPATLEIQQAAAHRAALARLTEAKEAWVEYLGLLGEGSQRVQLIIQCLSEIIDNPSENRHV